MKEVGIAFGSVEAALGTGECLTALVRFSKLTSSFPSGGFPVARPVVCIVGTGAEMTRWEGFMPLREFPFGKLSTQNGLERLFLSLCAHAKAG